MAGEPFYVTMPRDLGGAADRDAAAVGERQGRHPGDAAPPRRQGRRRPDHRVLRARARLAVGHGPARDRQHGRRTRRHHQRLPRGRAGPRVPAREGRGDDFDRADRRSRRQLRRDEEIDLAQPRAADRHASSSRATWCRSARWRASRSTRWSSARRPTRAARLRDAGRDHRRPAGPPAGVLRRQPDLAADPRGPDRDGRDAQPDQVRGADPPGRLQRVHRHGAGPRDRPQQPADRAAQLPRPIRHARGLGLPVLAGNGRGRGADRRDHRSPRPAVAARHRLPVAGPAAAVRRTARCPWKPRWPKRRAPGGAGQGAEHRLAAGLRRAARPTCGRRW